MSPDCRKHRMRWLISLLLFTLAIPAQAAITVRDDMGVEVRLTAPARRIVSLSPHGTELLFAAGAGEYIVGTVAHSDYPEAATRIPQVGTYVAFDLERIVALRPDLVVAWSSGNGKAEALERLTSFGIRVYSTEPRKLDDIATSLEKLGMLAGTPGTGNAAAQTFRARLARLRARYAQREPVSVFYQVWRGPLFTLGGPHIFSRVVEVCGGRNVFGELNTLALSVDLEAVLAADPQAIIASGMGEERPDWLDDWRQWPQLRAVHAGHLFFIPPNLLQRPTPRLLDGAERLCEALDRVRGERSE